MCGFLCDDENVRTMLSRDLCDVTFKLTYYFQELATFTSFNHPDLDDIIIAHQVIQSMMTSFDSVKKMDLLTAAFDNCDKNRLMWEKSGLSDKEGFMTKRGGNVKVVIYSSQSLGKQHPHVSAGIITISLCLAGFT